MSDVLRPPVPRYRLTLTIEGNMLDGSTPGRRRVVADDVLARAAEVLVWHQRTGPASCACGPMPLGTSHPVHQARMLADAGLLAESACPPRPTTHETLDSDADARVTAQRAATEAWKSEAERLRELLDEAHAKIERMEAL